jgi:hypothetical protein
VSSDTTWAGRSAAPGIVQNVLGVVLVLVLDFLPGFAAVAVGVLVALGAENRRSQIDLLERRGRRAAGVFVLGRRSWFPSLGGSSGPMLGDGQGLGDGGDGGGGGD